MSKALKDPNFLGSHDLVIGEKNEQPVYGELTLTIKSIEEEEITDMELIKTKKKNANGKQTKLAYVMHFEEPNVKPFVVKAATVIKGIEKATGTKLVNRWVGKKITFYVETGVKAFGDLHDALRVRPFAPVPPRTYKCADCGAETDETTKVRTTKMFGKCLCKNCGNKAYAEQKAAQETVTEHATETVEDMADVPS